MVIEPEAPARFCLVSPKRQRGCSAGERLSKPKPRWRFGLTNPCVASATAAGLAAGVALRTGPAADELDRRGFAPQAISDKAWGRTFVVRDPDGRRVEVKESM